MSDHILAFDLGTGGCKAALYGSDGACRAEAVREYATVHPGPGWDEQRPEDWWNAVMGATRQLMGQSSVARTQVRAIVLSGQSLALLPLDRHGALLTEWCPIWSDSRAGAQAEDFFARVPEATWYARTGNGFPPAHYTAFKAMWLRTHRPEVFAATRLILGSKDWINLRLTGTPATDRSYASGTGVYELTRGDYDDELLAAAELERRLLPEVGEATDVVGPLRRDAAEALGLDPGISVLCGGVDNSCMALGAGALAEGSVYGSLGSSSWLTVTSGRPVLDPGVRTFVFASVAPGLFHSAVSTFGAGTSLAWVRDLLLPDTDDEGRLFALAGESPPGARGLLFLPALGGGTMLEGGPDVRGAWIGLDVDHRRADLLRASLEGIAFALGRAYRRLAQLTPVAEEVLVVGGGALSSLWRQIYADVWQTVIRRTTVGRQAASLGAAAVAAVGLGLWRDFSPLVELQQTADYAAPDPTRAATYALLAEAFERAAEDQVQLAALLSPLRGMPG